MDAQDTFAGGVAATAGIDTTSPVPPYEQLRRALEERIVGGLVAPGARLPSVRRLAAELRVAPGTVQRAYRELRAAGLVSARARSGVVVAGDRSAATSTAADRLAGAARRYAEAARALGADDAGIRAAVDEVLAAG
jgi:DNA-binding transcriptional regulator YhcF (GntR family)